MPTLDHVVINTRDRMDEAEALYERLGFHLTPRGHHTLGTINHLAIFGTEYLGTMQLVTLATPHGMLRARLPAHVPMRRGERVGIDFVAHKLSVFDKGSGRAVRRGTAEHGRHG